jgi:hypothetical protein
MLGPFRGAIDGITGVDRIDYSSISGRFETRVVQNVKCIEIVKCIESFRGFLIYLRDGGAEMYRLDLKCMARVKCMESMLSAEFRERNGDVGLGVRNFEETVHPTPVHNRNYRRRPASSLVARRPPLLPLLRGGATDAKMENRKGPRDWIWGRAIGIFLRFFQSRGGRVRAVRLRKGPRDWRRKVLNWGPLDNVTRDQLTVRVL